MTGFILKHLWKTFLEAYESLPNIQNYEIVTCPKSEA